MSAPIPDSAAARGPFADWAGVYRRRGYWPRPITPGTKACHVREWQKPDSELSEVTLASWLASHAHFGIGLLMGGPFPDGTTLGALDVDHDEYIRIGQALLRDPPCGRIGGKGAIFFVRVRGRLSNDEFKVRGDDNKRYGKVAECLFVKKLCVIPPTIHPDTRQPYRWIGTPLHEVSFDELPIVEMDDA
jgi:Bifunctional DNA primase/polymerase, N-terminal